RSNIGLAIAGAPRGPGIPQLGSLVVARGLGLALARARTDRRLLARLAHAARRRLAVELLADPWRELAAATAERRSLAGREHFRRRFRRARAARQRRRLGDGEAAELGAARRRHGRPVRAGSMPRQRSLARRGSPFGRARGRWRDAVDLREIGGHEVRRLVVEYHGRPL